MIGSTLKHLEENTRWANISEIYIGLIKEAIRKDTIFSTNPLIFSDYCADRRSRLNQLTTRNLFQFEVQNSHFIVTGEEDDISNLYQYGWYDWCYYREQRTDFTLTQEILGSVLGTAKGQINETAQWVLKTNGNVSPCCTTRPLNTMDLNSEIEKKKKRSIFDKSIEKLWGTSMNPPPPAKHSDDDPFKEYEDASPRLIPEIEDPVDFAGREIIQQHKHDRMI